MQTKPSSIPQNQISVTTTSLIKTLTVRTEKAANIELSGDGSVANPAERMPQDTVTSTTTQRPEGVTRKSSKATKITTTVQSSSKLTTQSYYSATTRSDRGNVLIAAREAFQSIKNESEKLAAGFATIVSCFFSILYMCLYL